MPLQIVTKCAPPPVVTKAGAAAADAMGALLPGQTVIQTSSGPIGISNEVVPQMFALKSDSDDTSAVQRALDYLCDLQSDNGAMGTLLFPRGVYSVSGTLRVGKNTRVVAADPTFATAIRMAANFSGDSLFRVVGADAAGGWNFRVDIENVLIDCTRATVSAAFKVIQVDSAYSIGLRNIRTFGHVGTSIEVNNANHVTISEVAISGRSNAIDVSAYGIRCRGESSVTIISPDVENCSNGISHEDSAKIALVGHHLERNIHGLHLVGGPSGSCLIQGGKAESPGFSGVACHIKGHNITVIGGAYIGNGGCGIYVDEAERKSNVCLQNVLCSSADLHNPFGWAKVICDTDATGGYESELKNDKTPTSGESTAYYRITSPWNSASHAIFDLDVDARDESGSSLWSASYRFALTNPANAVLLTPVTEYGKSAINTSGNFSLSIAVAAVTVDAANVNVTITATSGGALGAGRTPRVRTRARLKQGSATGSVRFMAV